MPSLNPDWTDARETRHRRRGAFLNVIARIRDARRRVPRRRLPRALGLHLLQLGIEEVDAELRELRAELSGLVRCLLPRELRCGRRTHGCA